ncbi:MAG: helix-turn-helix domain-containing protein [Panacagrimonas sp.]
MDTQSEIVSGPEAFGRMLRDYRRGRRLSQLDLALNAEVSQRHLSFLESGRARPSREMVVQLAHALDLPLETRNRLLTAAGFASLYPRRRLDAEAMAPVRMALERMLAVHEPFPAMVVDRAWNLVMANRALPKMFALLGGMEAMAARVGGSNLLRVSLHPEGLRPYIANFEEFAVHLLARSAHEALEHPALDELLKEVLRYPGLPGRGRSVDISTPMLPVLPMRVALGGVELSLFTTLTTFGTPLDVTADELRIESLFPADADSEALMRRLLG